MSLLKKKKNVKDYSQKYKIKYEGLLRQVSSLQQIIQS